MIYIEETTSVALPLIRHFLPLGKKNVSNFLNGISSTMPSPSMNVNDLKDKIVKIWNADFDYAAIAKDAVSRYSSEAYYEKLMEIYKYV